MIYDHYKYLNKIEPGKIPEITLTPLYVDFINRMEHCVKVHNYPQVIVNGTTTILKFNDKSKYISKLCDGDTFDIEKGILMCIAKKSGYTSKDIQRLIEKAIYQKSKDGNKND